MKRTTTIITLLVLAFSVIVIIQQKRLINELERLNEKALELAKENQDKFFECRSILLEAYPKKDTLIVWINE